MRRYLTPKWLLGHLTALVLVAACLALGWWQVLRAGEGSLRSYAYAVEWPVFAGFVGFVWWREVRRARNAVEGGGEPGPAPIAPVQPDPGVTLPPAAAADDDDELTAYNRMLAWMNANPNRRITDYPG